MIAEAGRVYLVGAGPGDPELITVAGAELLATADVVLYDALASRELLRGTRAGAALVNVGKRAGRPSMSQEEINELIIHQAMAGKSVVRLKGGDPFVFGRGGEEALACFENEVPFTIVPGVTSAIAGPAYAGIPVTHRGVSRSFLVITGAEASAGDEGAIDWGAAAAADTIVLLMGNRQLETSLARLVAAGRPAGTPAAMIAMGTLGGQRVLKADISTLATKAVEAAMPGPALVVIGGVVNLSSELRWFRPGPLAGRTVVVTRATAQSGALSGLLSAAGATVIEAPLISVHFGASDEIRAAFELEWDWVLFTSSNAVEAMRRSFAEAGKDVRLFRMARIASIGEATSRALAGMSLVADFEPSRALGSALAEELPNPRRARVLYLASTLANDSLAAELRKRGASVTQLSAYRTATEPLDQLAIEEIFEADAVTFTSASTARSMAEALGSNELPERLKLVSIGPLTSAAVMEFFGRVDGAASEPSLEQLVKALEQALPGNGGESWA